MTHYNWDESTQSMKVDEATFNYCSKWACFNCRKSFTRTRVAGTSVEVKCPDCKRLAADMGHLFEVPPKRKVKEWKIAELLGKNRIRNDKVSTVVFIKRYIIVNTSLSLREIEKNIYTYIKRRNKI